jgi:agmatinase
VKPLHILLFVLLALAATASAQFMGDDIKAPAEPGVEPVIPLNRDDPTYNLWKLRRDDLSKGREPGPINVQRFPGGFGATGIPTFFRLPVALTPEDLRAGQVEVAMIGAYTDMGFGSRGAVYGPGAFRLTPADYVPWGEFSMEHMGTMVNPFAELVMVDYGDAPVDPLSTERSVHAIRELVREVVEVKLDDGRRVFPIVIGGDHSLMYPDVAALVDVYGKRKVGPTRRPSSG